MNLKGKEKKNFTIVNIVFLILPVNNLIRVILSDFLILKICNKNYKLVTMFVC